MINSGLIGFNALLCSIAVYSLISDDLRLAVCGAGGSTILLALFYNIDGLIPLAAGFVSMTWLLIFLAWLNPRFNAKPAEAAAAQVRRDGRPSSAPGCVPA